MAFILWYYWEKGFGSSKVIQYLKGSLYRKEIDIWINIKMIYKTKKYFLMNRSLYWKETGYTMIFQQTRRCSAKPVHYFHWNGYICLGVSTVTCDLMIHSIIFDCSAYTIHLKIKITFDRRLSETIFS